MFDGWIVVIGALAATVVVLVAIHVLLPGRSHR
jgi:hypothetical protein